MSVRPHGMGDSAQPDAAHPTTLEALYRRYAGFVWRAARRLGAPDHALDDIVHDVFVLLHRRLDDYDGRSAWMTWLYHLTRGTVSNFRRRADRHERRLRLIAPPPSAVPDPDRHLESERAASAVAMFLSQLDPDRRAVFELSDIDGMSAPAIAEALGVKLNTVYSRLRVARDRFRAFASAYRDGRGSCHG